MKKSLLALLLAVALVTPVFATDNKVGEIDVKAGFNFMSNVTVDNTDYDKSVDSAFAAGADLFFCLTPQLAIGAGVDYIFNHELPNLDGLKAGWTNIYVQAKYMFETGNNTFNNVYPLFQIGGSILRLDTDSETEVDSNGLYWAIGAGTTIKENFLLEILYSKCNAKVKEDFFRGDLKYSTLQLKVGYKLPF